MADLAISRKGREKATGKVKHQGSRLGGSGMMSKVRAQRNQRSFSCPEFSRKQGDERTDDSIGGGGGGVYVAVCVFAGVHNDAKPIQCHWRVKGSGKGCGEVL